MHLKLRWRALALLAIATYVFAAFLIIVLVSHNLGFAIVLGFTIILLVYAGWLLFTGVGKRRSWGIVTAIAGLTLLVLNLDYFLSNEKNRRAFLLVALLSLAYSGLAGVLRRQYWHEKRHQSEGGGKATRFKTPYLIINPKSGNGRALKAHVPELARRQDIRVLITKKGDDIETLARKSVEGGADALGISGGDGSIGAVAKVAIEYDLPVVVLPGGTRCHFARDLGLDPKRIADSLAGFTGVERRVDVGEINGRIFLNNASFGLYADIVNHPAYREHKIQETRRVLSSIIDGSKELYDLHFRYEALRFQKAVQVLVGVNRYNTVNLIELGHRDRLDGGDLHVIVMTQLNDKMVNKLLRATSLHRLQKQAVPGIYQWAGKSFRITTSGTKLVVGVDGECEQFDKPVNVRILPGALRIYVPAEGARPRTKSAFSLPVLKRIWQETAHKSSRYL